MVGLDNMLDPRGRVRRRRDMNKLISIGERVGFDGSALANTSRLVAKVDSAAVQDGFDLYLHGFIVTNDGQWVVVQQGFAVSSSSTPHCAYHPANASISRQRAIEHAPERNRGRTDHVTLKMACSLA
jgi:hypothetical protein